jgi:microcystin-dependent protein
MLMSRDSNGIYSLPPGYLATTGQTILASQHNPPLEDLAQAMTGSLPRSGTAPMQANLQMAGYKVVGSALGTLPDDLATVAQLPPVGSITDYAGATAPAGWLLCYGQEISRTTYAALFAILSTTYGAGNGTTTFNVPDCRGRVTAGKDNMGGTLASRLVTFTGGSLDGKTLGASGGLDRHALTIAQLAAHDHGGDTGPGTPHSHTYFRVGAGGSGSDVASGGDRTFSLSTTTGTESAHTHPITAQGSGAAHNNVQPTIIFNKIIRTGV